MAFMGTESASSSSSSFAMRGWTYDVYLSFRGADTSKNFTDHLYAALNQKGIFTFRDDEELEQGTVIAPELLKAIEESRFAVVILSRDYASSSGCLTELAKIIECMKKTRLIVLPVFHYVDPSDVRNQRGTFAEAFAKHEERFKDNIEDVDAWRAALEQVASIAGFHLREQHESKVIEEIVGKILDKLNSRYSIDHKDLVGINSHMEKLENLLGKGLNDVRFIGIWGMGGMGKTTLAQVVYEKFQDHFEGKSFLKNVREESGKGLVTLQKQLLEDILTGKNNIDFSNIQWGTNVIGERLCGKRVLVILDDVDQYNQLEALAGKKSWFGNGSRIIITTRDQDLLIKHQVAEAQIYKLKGLNNDEALKLFSRKAFQKDHPPKGYEELSQKFIYYAHGLPLAVEVLGSFLHCKSRDLWESTPGRFKKNPLGKILEVLQISFDSLEEREKEIFLDIACFFKGECKSHVTNILQILYDKPDIDIDVLLKKSLITISWDNFQMHDLLQELGKEIVQRESPEKAGRRTRLWHTKDVLHVLKDNTGTEFVKGIFLNSPPKKEIHLNAEAFSGMKNLRLLKINNVKLPEGLNYLSSKLRFIHWDGYPLESMPTSFEPDKLVELHMCCSLIKQLWKGSKSLDELKVIDLSDSQNLIETPDLSRVPNLEQLILQRCTRLSKIHASLGNLKRLIHLDLNGCECLERLPHKINLKSLKVFILSGCSRLKKFPKIVRKMSRLSELYLNETTIKDLPSFVKHFTGLIKLDLRDCKNLSSLPDVICSLSSLETLTLSGCTKLDKLPEKLGDLKGLEELDVSGTAITELPSSVFYLKNLKVLSLGGCEGLLSKSSNEPLSFPLMEICSDPMGMLVPRLLELRTLRKLNLSYCNLWTIPDALGSLCSLRDLNLNGNNFVSLPESISRLSNLDSLYFCGCTGLRSLPQLPINVGYIYADGCTSLETLSLRPEYDFYLYLSLLDCIKLIDNQGYGDMFLTMLRHHLQLQGDEDYGTIIPRREIPKWFTHRSAEASLKIKVPSDLCDKLMGIVVCAVFVLRQHHPIDQLHCKYLNWNRVTHELWCHVNANKCENSCSVGSCFSEEFGKIESYHLFLRYYPSAFFDEAWKEASSKSRANGSSEIEIIFETRGPGLEVTKCGAELVFGQDIEDPNHTMAGCCSCSITRYEDDFDNSTNETKIKRSLDDYYGDGDGDGAGPSGEGTSKSNDVDVPHPKRIRLPNLIERFILRFGSWFGNSRTQGQGDADCEEEKSQ